MALVVFAAIASIEFLTDRSSDEVVNQADCVSLRPPPPECQVAAIPPNFVPGGVGFVSPTTAPPAPDPPPTADIGPASIPAEVPAGAPWTVTVPVDVTVVPTEPPLPVLGTTVRARVRLQDPAATPAAFLPVSEFITCLTDDTGACDLVYEVPGAPFPDVPALRIDEFVVDTVPPAVVTLDPPGPSIDVLRPPVP